MNYAINLTTHVADQKRVYSSLTLDLMSYFPCHRY